MTASTESKFIGTVKTFFGSRGFGFITVRESEGKPQTKYYLHVSEVVSGEVTMGSRVRFSVNPIREGQLPSAIDVEVIEGGVA